LLQAASAFTPSLEYVRWTATASALFATHPNAGVLTFDGRMRLSAPAAPEICRTHPRRCTTDQGLARDDRRQDGGNDCGFRRLGSQ